MLRHCRLACLACMLAGLATGCQQAADTAAEAAIERAGGDKVEVDREGDHVRITTAEGQLDMRAGESLALPSDFPKDVYLPARYEVSSVMDMGGMRVVNVSTRGRVPALFDAARRSMAVAGWKQTMAMQHSADNAVLSFEKEQRAAVLSFNKGEGRDGVVMGIQLRRN